MQMPEDLVIRPPSEAASLLVRVVRGCDWNRCRFCGIYDLYGVPHSRRPLAEVCADIDALKLLHGDRFTTAFLGDANPLGLPTDFLTGCLEHLRRTFPALSRVTCYGRVSSLAKKSPEELRALQHAGLDRVHAGMESGADEVLRLQRKGTNSAQLVTAGRRVREAGLELSYYLLSGLGGQELWHEHVASSTAVINAVEPDFVRVRRLWIHPASRLQELVEQKTFSPQPPEGTVIELKHLLEGLLPLSTTLICDHANNYVQVSGRLDARREDMLHEVNTFLALPQARRQAHYARCPSVI